MDVLVNDEVQESSYTLASTDRLDILYNIALVETYENGAAVPQVCVFIVIVCMCASRRDHCHLCVM
jgi:hypothetical protein